MAKKFAEHNGLNLTQTNNDVLAAWEKNDIFHKSIDERIRKLTRELSDTHPDTENVEYEEADLPLDEIFKEEDDGQGENE